MEDESPFEEYWKKHGFTKKKCKCGEEFMGTEDMDYCPDCVCFF